MRIYGTHRVNVQLHYVKASFEKHESIGAESYVAVCSKEDLCFGSRVLQSSFVVFPRYISRLGNDQGSRGARPIGDAFPLSEA